MIKTNVPTWFAKPLCLTSSFMALLSSPCLASSLVESPAGDFFISALLMSWLIVTFLLTQKRKDLYRVFSKFFTLPQTVERAPLRNR